MINDFIKLRLLFEQLLNEDLSAGCKSILNNKKTVSQLANRIKSDIFTNAASFPSDIKSKYKKMSDEEIATWFLNQLDKIEKEGYREEIYSQNGQNARWIVNYYISGRDNWEDISGSMPIHMSKWKFLKDRNALLPTDIDVQQFFGVKDLGKTIVTEPKYREPLVDFDNAILTKKMKSWIRAFKIVDNDDYRVYITFNRAANLTLGKGTTWCTTNNSPDSTFFNQYANPGFLMQIFPKNPENIEKNKSGRKIAGAERYQFDQSGPYFMDIADDPVRPPSLVIEKFPYLYDDLVKSTTAQKAQLQKYIDDINADPALQKDSFSKTVKYNVDEEIKKLKRFVDKGFMQETPRPPKEPELEAEPEVPALSNSGVPIQRPTS